MKKKKGIIISIIVLIALALLIMGLVIGKNHRDDDNAENTNKNEVTNKTTSNTTKDKDDEPVDNSVSNQTAYITQPSTVNDNAVDYSYDDALSAVKNAEETLDNESLQKAEDLISQVKDNDKKEELTKRLEEVKKAMDVKDLLDELSSKVDDAEDKDGIDEARKFVEENDLASKLDELTNEELKNQLQEEYEELQEILNDNKAPEVNIEDGAILSEKTVVEITDDNEYTAELTKNGETVEFASGDEVDEGEYSLKVVDDAYNVINISFIVDETAPVFNVEDGVISNTDLDVSVTDLTFEKTNVLNETTKEENEVGSEFTLNKDGKYVLTAYDLTGRTSVVNVTIDKTSPVVNISYSTTELTNQNVIVTLTSNEEIQSPSGWTKVDELTYTMEYAVNTNETITVQDLAGNASQVEISITNIDKVAPEVDLSYAPREMTNENVTATITVNEEIIDIEGWTKNNSTTYTKIYESNAEETITVEDLAGNTTSVDIKIENIDKVLPEVDVTYSTTEPTNEDVTVTISASEEIEEIEGWTKVDEKTYTKVYSSNTITEVEGDNETTETIDYEEITITDLVGNSTIVNISVTNIDREAPVIEVTYDPTQTTALGVTATITGDEELAELEGWTKVDATTLTKTYEDNITETIEVSDLAGNITSVNILIENIDKTIPGVEVTYSTTEPTNENVTVTITTTQEIEELEGWTKVDETTYTKVYEENTTEDVTITSLTGATNTAHVEITNIDKTAPVVEVTYSTTEPTDESVTVTLTVDEEVQDPEGWTKVDEASYTKEYEENTTESVTVTDLAGNTSEVSIVIENINEVLDTTPNNNNESTTTNPEISPENP